jgi:predicted PurR-regulated permease PerM
LRRIRPGNDEGEALVAGLLVLVASSVGTAVDVRPEPTPDEPRVALVALAWGLVVVCVLAAAAALWKAHVVLLLLFLAYTLAAAVRPTVVRLIALGVPRWVAVGALLAATAGIVALLLWLFVPVALDQTQAALRASSRPHADDGTLETLRRHVLEGAQRKLSHLADPGAALSAALDTLTALATLAFTIAAASYWIAERDRVVETVLSLVPRPQRQTVRDVWLLIDLKLGAVIRTKLVLVVMTATILSVAFWVAGIPYFLIVATFAGIVEVLPVIGPLLAGLAAVAAGLTVSLKLGAVAAAIVYGLRLLQDYVINPRLFGRAVHLPPLVVFVAVSAVALLLGPWWVPLAIPLTAIVATLLDVVVWKRDPAAAQVPSVLLPTDDTVEARRRPPRRRRRLLRRARRV